MPFEVLYRNSELSVSWDWPAECDCAQLQRAAVSLDNYSGPHFHKFNEAVEKGHTPVIRTGLLNKEAINHFRICFYKGDNLVSSYDYPGIHYYGTQQDLNWRTRKEIKLGDKALILEIESPERICKKRLWLNAGSRRLGLPEDIGLKTTFIVPDSSEMYTVSLDGDEYVKKKYMITNDQR